MKRFLVLIMVLTFLSGCAMTQQESAAKSLLVAKEAIVSTASSADALCSANALTQDQCDKMAELYGDAGSAYDLAVASLMATIAANESGESWDNYTTFHNQFLELYTKFINAAVEFGLLEVQK